jgi:hypothetical protein
MEMMCDMKTRDRFLSTLFALSLAVAPALGQQISVQTEKGKETVLTRADIETLPRIKVAVTAPVSATFEGVLLKDALARGGVGFGETMRGEGMASCLLVEATDGYRVVIALPEIDPAFTDKQFVLAFSKDGKPLDSKEGPYRIVIPEEKRMARWVRQVTTLKIVAVQ